MNPRAYWHRLKAQNRRESDERVRTIGLLAVRDGLVAIMLLIGVFLLLWSIVGSGMSTPLFLMVAVFVTGSVIGISATLRSRFGWSSGTVIYRSVWILLGMLVGLSFVVVLSATGVLPSLGRMWPTLFGVAMGSVVGTTIWLLLLLFQRNS